MAPPTDPTSLQNEIRKMRKKLRQIDNLHRLGRPLSEEEEDKVASTPDIRSLLREKLKELAAIEPPSFEADFSKTEDNKDERSGQELQYPDDNQLHEQVVDQTPDDSPEDMKRLYSEVKNGQKGQSNVVTGGQETLPKSQGENEGSEDEGQTPPKVLRQQAEPEKVAKQEKASTSNQGKTQTSNKGKGTSNIQNAPDDSWARAKFTARDLEGHNDVICAVSCTGSRLLTGSRDTMVKYWDLETGAELRSIGGHSRTVTSVILLSNEESSHLASQFDLSSNDRIGVTGSKDCYIKVWSLETGQSLHSVYTYNPVECLGFIAQSGLIVSGSDGGKVELLDIVSGSNVFSTLGHDDAVTCIQVNDLSVYTSSSDGIIKLWKLRDGALHPTFVSENISSKSSTRLLARRHVRSLAILGDTIYYGDDGLNVKALEWKKGLVHKLKNHSGDFGSTDAMCSSKELLICAGYNLDTGCGYLNFWSLPEEVYLATLTDQDVSRIIAMDYMQTQEGALRIVTGGRELRVWDRIPKKRYSPQDAIPTEFNFAFSVKAQDSDADSDTDEMSESDGGGANQGIGRRLSEGSQASTKSSWSSWCTVI